MIHFDWLPALAHHFMLLSLTVLNLGMMCKSPIMSVPLGCAQVSCAHPEYNEVRELFYPAFRDLENAARAGAVTIGDKASPVIFYVCNDDEANRVHLHMCGCKASYVCTKCTATRGTPDKPNSNFCLVLLIFSGNIGQQRPEWDNFDTAGAVFGVLGPRMLRCIPNSHVIICLLHMMMAFGRMTGKLLCDRIIPDFIAHGGSADTFVAVQEWADYHKIRVQFARRSARGKMNISGRGSARLLKFWSELSSFLGDHSWFIVSLPIIEDVWRVFRALYIFRFDAATPNYQRLRAELIWVVNNAMRIGRDFAQLAGQSYNKKNYLHFWIFHLSELVQWCLDSPGQFGVWAFASDVAESLNAFFKCLYVSRFCFSNFIQLSPLLSTAWRSLY